MTQSSISAEKVELDLLIEEQNITESMINQAQFRNYYGAQASRAKGKVDSLKLELQILESQLDTAIRKDSSDKGAKITEGAIAAKIKQSKRWENLSRDIIDAEDNLRVLQNVTTSFDHRRDMIVQLSKHMLEERKGQLHLNSIEAESAHSQNIARAAIKK